MDPTVRPRESGATIVLDALIVELEKARLEETNGSKRGRIEVLTKYVTIEEYGSLNSVEDKKLTVASESSEETQIQDK